MNRLIETAIGQTNQYDRPTQPVLELEWLAARKLILKRPGLVNEAAANVLIPVCDNAGNLFSLSTSQQVIDFDTQGNGGLIDGFSLVSSSIYNLWGLTDANFQTNLIGLTYRPALGATIPSGANKGTETTVTGMTNAYRLILGSRVRVYRGAGDWNLGTVSALVSETSVKIILDNNQVFGATYGSNLTTGSATITQLDRFKPIVYGSAQDAVKPYYSLIASIQLDGSGNIQGWWYPWKPIPGTIGEITWFHKSLVTKNAFFDPDQWLDCSGTVVMIDQSPFVGQTLPNINSTVSGYNGGRFIRGGATSGTTQDGTKISQTSYRTGSPNGYVENLISNSDGQTTSATLDFLYGAYATNSTGAYVQYHRPVNISMVAMMRVR